MALSFVCFVSPNDVSNDVTASRTAPGRPLSSRFSPAEVAACSFLLICFSSFSVSCPPVEAAAPSPLLRRFGLLFSLLQLLRSKLARFKIVNLLGKRFLFLFTFLLFSLTFVSFFISFFLSRACAEVGKERRHRGKVNRAAGAELPRVLESARRCPVLYRFRTTELGYWGWNVFESFRVRYTQF